MSQFRSKEKSLMGPSASLPKKPNTAAAAAQNHDHVAKPYMPFAKDSLHSSDYEFLFLPGDIESMEAHFREDPRVVLSGQLVVTEVLLRVLAYLEPKHPTLLNVVRVNRQWRFYGNFLPQWMIYAERCHETHRLNDLPLSKKQCIFGVWLARMLQCHCYSSCQALAKAGAVVGDEEFSRLPLVDVLYELNEGTTADPHSMTKCSALPRPIRSDFSLVLCSCVDPKLNSAMVWGTGPYTNDSNMCKAAAHAGIGSTFSIKYIGLLPAYGGSTQNAVTTRSFGPFDGVTLTAQPGRLSWSGILTSLQPCPLSSRQLGLFLEKARDLNLQRAFEWVVKQARETKVELSASHINRLVDNWGTCVQRSKEPTSGSMIQVCELLTARQRAEFFLEIYRKADARSDSDDSVLAAPAMALATGDCEFSANEIVQLLPFLRCLTEAGARASGNVVNSRDVLYCHQYARVQTAKLYVCECRDIPASNVWGSNPYTYDSNICRAARHAGVKRGRPFRIENFRSLPSYKGSTRNDITTMDYGGFIGFDLIPGLEMPTEKFASFIAAKLLDSLDTHLRGIALAYLCEAQAFGAAQLLVGSGPIPGETLHLAALCFAGQEVRVSVVNRGKGLAKATDSSDAEQGLY